MARDRRIPKTPDRGQASFAGVRRRSPLEELEAVHEDERKLGRPHFPSERDAFVRGFHGAEYGEEIRRLMALGVEEPGGDDEEGS